MYDKKYALEINFGLSGQTEMKPGDIIDIKYLLNQASAFEDGQWQ